MSSILGIFGGVMSAQSSKEQGKEQEKQLEQERTLTMMKTQQTMGDINEARGLKNQDFDRQIATIKSTQRAQVGASGVKLEGSPIETMLYTESLGREAQRRMNYYSDVEINRTREWGAIKAAQLRYSARLARKTGNMNYISGMFGASGQAMNSASSIGTSVSNYNSGTGSGWSILAS